MLLRADLSIGFLVLKVFFGLILTFQAGFNFFWSLSVSIHKRYRLTSLESTRSFFCLQLMPCKKNHNLRAVFSERDKRDPEILIVRVCLGLKSNSSFLQWATQNVAERKCVVIFKEQFLRAWFWSETWSSADTNLHQSNWCYISLNKWYCTDPFAEETLLETWPRQLLLRQRGSQLVSLHQRF